MPSSIKMRLVIPVDADLVSFFRFVFGGDTDGCITPE
jgi:hypothetical protein